MTVKHVVRGEDNPEPTLEWCLEHGTDGTLYVICAQPAIKKEWVVFGIGPDGMGERGRGLPDDIGLLVDSLGRIKLDA